MAHTKSAKKRDRQNAERNVRNRGRKSRIRTAERLLETAVKTGEGDVDKSLANCQSLIDQASGNKTLHKNTAARRKSKLARLAGTAKTSPDDQ